MFAWWIQGLVVCDFHRYQLAMTRILQGSKIIKQVFSFLSGKFACLHAASVSETKTQECERKNTLMKTVKVTCKLSVKLLLLSAQSNLSHVIYPLSRGPLGHHRWFCSQFPPFFLVLHCPLGLAKLQACPFPDVVFPALPLSALSSSPFHCALQDGFGQAW